MSGRCLPGAGSAAERRSATPSESPPRKPSAGPREILDGTMRRREASDALDPWPASFAFPGSSQSIQSALAAVPSFDA